MGGRLLFSLFSKKEENMDKPREMAAQIIDLFEGLLEKYNVVINSEDRQEALQEDEEGIACIYGDEYYSLEDKITKMIDGIQK